MGKFLDAPQADAACGTLDRVDDAENDIQAVAAALALLDAEQLAVK